MIQQNQQFFVYQRQQQVERSLNRQQIYRQQYNQHRQLYDQSQVKVDFNIKSSFFKTLIDEKKASCLFNRREKRRIRILRRERIEAIDEIKLNQIIKLDCRKTIR